MSHNVAELASKLADADVVTRRQAAEALARLGPEAATAAIPLVQACADRDEQVRDWVVAALEELPAPAATELTALSPLVSDPNLDVAYWAATLLGRMRGAAAPAVSTLTAALSSHSELVVQQRAAWALGSIGPPASAAIPQLEQAAASPDAQLARLAKAALASIRG